MYRFSDEEFHVFIQFLKREHPKAYFETMAHLQGYQEFMVEQAKTWFELREKSPGLKLPKSIARTMSRNVCDKPEVVDAIFDAEYDTDDDFFNSPRNLKIIDFLLDPTCPKSND